MKTARHPNGEIITFYHGNHTYIDSHGNDYTSVTSYVGRFLNQFHEYKIAYKVTEKKGSVYFGMHPLEVLSQWKQKADTARSEGTNLHEYIENRIFGLSGPDPISDRCEKLFKTADRMIENILKEFEPISAEYIIFDPAFYISGTIDFIAQKKSTGDIYIFDWKQNSKIEQYSLFTKPCLPPIEHIEDTTLAHYELQLSFYKYLFWRNQYFDGIPEDNIKCFLAHIKEDSFEIIPVRYLKKEIEDMLLSWIKI